VPKIVADQVEAEFGEVKVEVQCDDTKQFQPESGEVEGEVYVQGEAEVHVHNESHEVDNEVQNETHNEGVQEQNAEEVEVEDGCSKGNIDEDSNGLIDVDMDYDPTVKAMHIREKGLRKWNVSISRAMSFRARSMAVKKIDGSFIEQYKCIYYYDHELRRSNLGSTIKIKVEDHDGSKIFQRLYVCLKAWKDSFVSCRCIVGLDGCFLKGISMVMSC